MCNNVVQKTNNNRLKQEDKTNWRVNLSVWAQFITGTHMDLDIGQCDYGNPGRYKLL